MIVSHLVSYFFGGAFLANAVPHLVAGLMGRGFQSPFAKPHGEGFSSSAVNSAWGSLNLVVAWLLLFQVGEFDAHRLSDAGPALLAIVLMSLMAAKSFGRFNGGNIPLKAEAVQRSLLGLEKK